jgi:crotonobetainyl-CoA:carnitine CoA-transferase CaiB-like acyl-CoA transferase
MDETQGASPALQAVDWTTFDPTRATQAEVDALEADIAPFICSLTKDEFFARFVERNMLGYKVSTVEDIRTDPQLTARAFWHQVQSPWAAEQALPFPGSFGLFDGQRPALRRLAPALGEHTDEVRCEWLRVHH